MEVKETKTEEAIPNPEYLIKSIAEQGYSLESALADLVDNSLFANADKIEVLTDLQDGALLLFLTDNGNGMSEKELKKNMLFPSELMENERSPTDLGRFGLGMKTASFSQTRRFTVISRLKGTSKYYGRTWDVELLKKGEWKVIIEPEEEVQKTLKFYLKLQSLMIGNLENYEPNTIIYWNGLYKFDDYLSHSKKQGALNKQLNEVTRDYLGLVFHRFMQKKLYPLQIKLNNLFVEPFDPFPNNFGIRSLGSEQYALHNDVLSMEGFVLPSSALKTKNSIFSTEHRGLMDLEGMFIYRLDRIINFGGWNDVIKKRSNIQLARLKIDVGNASDSLLQLNVAKSNVVIPFDLRKGFYRYILRLAEEARKEYFNKEISGKKISKSKSLEMFGRIATSKGNKVKFNDEYPLIKELNHCIPSDKNHLFKTFLRTIETRINKIRHVHDKEDFVSLIEENLLSEKELEKSIIKLIESGFSSKEILKIIENDLGLKPSSLPQSIKVKINYE